MLIFVVTLIITSFAATSASPLNIYSEESRPVTDVVNTTSFFWYQADDGSVVKAYYEGGPTLNAKSSLHTVILYHHTRSYPEGLQLSLGDTCAKISSYWKYGAPLVMLIHGFTGSMSGSPVCHDTALTYVENYDCNVISVDWSEISAAPWYDTASEGTGIVGDAVAVWLTRIVYDCYLINLADVHLVGHSLGAHVAGYIGMYYHMYTGKKLPRISGLDPAGPLFFNRHEDNRLDPSDALFVDVIHTNGGYDGWGHLGYLQSCGHVDFYPNGGSAQPACDCWYCIFGDVVGACSHGMAVKYYMESIGHPEKFKAYYCGQSVDNCAQNQYISGYSGYMGEGCSEYARGLYWLPTNADSPYSF